MRRLLKSFTAFSVIAMLLFSFCISVGAVEETHNSQDGLVASITTKKDGYQSNEDIDLTFKVTNTNDFTVENVSLEAILPENFEVKDNKKQDVDYVSLKSGESITLDIVAIKVNNTATKPDNTKATATSKSNIEETTKILIPDVQAVTSATDGVSKNSVLATQNSSVKSEESVKTGNNMAVFLVVSICIVSFAVIIVLKNRNNVRKYLSIVLCFSIISGVVTVGGVSMVNAAEMEQKSFTVNKEINVSIFVVIYPLICNMLFRAIITTNIDTLIEDAFQKYACEKIKVWTQNDINENLELFGERFLLKLHGTYERQNTVVLGTQGYLDSIYKNKIMIKLMESLLLSNTFLFIGYSMSDPDLNNILNYLNVISNSNNRIHYLAIEKGKIFSLEKKYLRKHKNIIILEYENKTGYHEGIIDLLNELKKKKIP